jgi:2,4-dienoyl-CoA reductase-like NADH-dependent reductase (Old Yellow Enzyme family)
MNLFDPLQLGAVRVSNRAFMAPMTRSRAADHIATPMIATYYRQRASAGLIISEGTPISREGQGYLFNPSLYTPEQVAGWRLSTDAVHQAGGHIFAQLWHVGRISHTSLQAGGALPVGAGSMIARDSYSFARDEHGAAAFVPASMPRALETAEIARVVQDFAMAAVQARAAGFDGIELHAANGFLFEQFMNPASNDRSDRYSAHSLENRLRFTLEVVDAVSARIGADRVGIRISPYGQINDMPPLTDTDELFECLGRELARRRIAYLHLMDQSGFRMGDATLPVHAKTVPLLRKLRTAFDNGALILAGGQTLDSANRLIGEGLVDAVAFGHPYIANPDLVERLRHGWPLAEPDRSSFYGGDQKGYIDYPAYEAVAN